MRSRRGAVWRFIDGLTSADEISIYGFNDWSYVVSPWTSSRNMAVMAMSVRNFERVFTREVGTTPSQYVLQARVEAARRLLERTDRGLKHVASTAGFGSVDVASYFLTASSIARLLASQIDDIWS